MEAPEFCGCACFRARLYWIRICTAMLTRSFILALLLAGCTMTGAQLTQTEKEKLDPALQRLVQGTSTSRADYDITPGPSGEDRFGVMVRTDRFDDLRNAGYTVTSTFGDMAVVRVTIAQLRSLVTIPSVKNVTNGSKNRPQ
jgi:hypothetical protein